MGKHGRWLAGLFLAVLVVIFADATIDIWPALGVQSDVCAHVNSLPENAQGEYRAAIKKAYKIACKYVNGPITRVNVEGMKMALSPDQALMAAVAMFAGLGGALLSILMLFGIDTDARSGRRSLSWAVLRPFAAIAFGLVVYALLRAVVLPQGNLATANPYGFLALAVVTGLCIDIFPWLMGKRQKSG